MNKFRIVRVFGEGVRPTTAKAYRVETVELMTENEAFQLMQELGSPYIGRKYEDAKAQPKHIVKIGSEVKTRSGVFPGMPYVKQKDGSWKPKYSEGD